MFNWLSTHRGQVLQVSVVKGACDFGSQALHLELDTEDVEAIGDQSRDGVWVGEDVVGSLHGHHQLYPTVGDLLNIRRHREGCLRRIQRRTR